MELTHFSLCSGIGGLDLAAEWAGFKTAAQCEIDEYASKVLAKNFKGVPNLHDIRTVTNERLAEFGIDAKQITVVSAGSRASRTVLREKVEAIVTVVTCGARLQECSEKLNRDGLSAKILPVYSQDKISDFSVECSMTLPRWGIASGGEFGALVTSVRHTEESASSCWVGTPTTCMTKRSERYREGRTPNPVELVETFPTITVCGNYNRKGVSKTSGDGLATYVRMYPTPMATQRGDCPAERRRHSPCLESVVAMQEPNGGKLNPTWVEWLMGFPLGWTDLDVSETQ